MTPALATWLIVGYGWRVPFFVFGSLGIVWAAVWFFYYRDTPAEHSAVNDAELDLIHAAVGKRTSRSSIIPWRAILTTRTLWMMSAMYFCYGYCINLYLYWFPTYLLNHRGFSMTEMGVYASLPLLSGAIGDLAGGWVSDLWLKRTGDLKKARRYIGFIGFVIAAATIIPAALTQNPYTSVWFSCLAVFGIEVTVGVSWALPLDIGGDHAGSVSAVMNTCGNIGGSISPLVVGYLVYMLGWNEPFFIASVLCGIAALLYLKIDATKRVANSEHHS